MIHHRYVTKWGVGDMERASVSIVAQKQGCRSHFDRPLASLACLTSSSPPQEALGSCPHWEGEEGPALGLGGTGGSILRRRGASKELQGGLLSGPYRLPL